MVCLKKVDEVILNFMGKKIHNHVLDKVVPFVTKCGDFGAVWIVVSVLLMNTRVYKRQGIMVAMALLLNTIVGEGIIKNMVKRRRPCENMDGLLVSKPSTYSFPSGHTSASFAVMSVFINTMVGQYCAYVALVALLISLSRLYLFVHYPTDVAAGAVLGVGCAIIVCYAYPVFA